MRDIAVSQSQVAEVVGCCRNDGFAMRRPRQGKATLQQRPGTSEIMSLEIDIPQGARGSGNPHRVTRSFGTPQSLLHVSLGSLWMAKQAECFPPPRERIGVPRGVSGQTAEADRISPVPGAFR